MFEKYAGSNYVMNQKFGYFRHDFSEVCLLHLEDRIPSWLVMLKSLFRYAAGW